MTPSEEHVYFVRRQMRRGVKWQSIAAALGTDAAGLRALIRLAFPPPERPPEG